MITAFFRALGDLGSPEFRGVLLKSIGLTLVLFAALFVGVQSALEAFAAVSSPWLEMVIDVAAGLGTIAAFFVLLAPVTALFAGLFLDRIASLVEARHYPADPPGTALPVLTAIAVALRFGALVLAVTLIALPALFLGIGALVMLIANAYLLSREYFELAAMRHMTPEAARALRAANMGQVFAAGFAPAFMAAVPIVNLLVPLFATSYFTHFYKQITPSSPDSGRGRG